MDEILASIRRSIAEDDATKTPQRAPEPPKAAPRPAAPPPPAPVEPEVEEPEPVAASADVESEAADILDLTESMAAPSFSEPDPEPEPSPAPQFRKIEGISDVSFDESEQKPTVARVEPGARHPLSTAGRAAVDPGCNTLTHTLMMLNASKF